MTGIPIERGQGLLEYALIISIVAVLIIALLFLFGNQIGSIYSNIISLI
jgi:pilus assembly protein Flp/PilA